jgi:hypothetical protein
LVSLALLVGLGVNVGINWLLLPLWGIRGAAMAVVLANLVLLLTGYGLIARRGMRVTFGTLLVSAAPAALCLGPWVSLAVFAILIVLSAATPVVFNREEKEQLTAFARDHFQRGRLWCRAIKGHGEPPSSTSAPAAPLEGVPPN